MAPRQYQEAAALFEKSLQLRPNDPVLHYNTAAALFQLGRFEDAGRHYLEARARADAGLRTKIDYALGNTALSQGDFVEAIRHYDDCLNSTAKGAAFDAVRHDAAINRAYVVEQARRSITPPDDESDTSSKSSEPKKPSGKNGDRSNQQSPGNAGSAPGQNPENPANTAVRGPGGAGGSGPAPPELRRSRRPAHQGDGERPRSPQAEDRPAVTRDTVPATARIGDSQHGIWR